MPERIFFHNFPMCWTVKVEFESKNRGPPKQKIRDEIRPLSLFRDQSLPWNRIFAKTSKLPLIIAKRRDIAIRICVRLATIIYVRFLTRNIKYKTLR